MEYLCESCVNFPCSKDMHMMQLSCPVYSPEPKPITNADRIRAMSDEELADWVWGAETAGRAYGPRGKKAWLDWLRKEASE